VVPQMQMGFQQPVIGYQQPIQMYPPGVQMIQHQPVIVQQQPQIIGGGYVQAPINHQQQLIQGGAHLPHQPQLGRVNTIDAKVDKYRDKLIRKKQKEEIKKRQSVADEEDDLQAAIARRKARRKEREEREVELKKRVRQRKYTRCRVVLFMFLIIIPTILSTLCFYADVKLILSVRDDSISYGDDVDFMKEYNETQSFYCSTDGPCILLADPTQAFFRTPLCRCTAKPCYEAPEYTNCGSGVFDQCTCPQKYLISSPQVNASIFAYNGKSSDQQLYICNPELTHEAILGNAETNIENFFIILFWTGAVFTVLACPSCALMNYCRLRMACMKYSDPHDEVFLIPEEDIPEVSPDTLIDSPSSIVTTPDTDSSIALGSKKPPSTLTEKNLKKLDKRNQGHSGKFKYKHQETDETPEVFEESDELDTAEREEEAEEMEKQKTKRKKRKTKVFVYMLSFTVLMNILEFVPLGIVGLYYIIYWNNNYGVYCMSKFREDPSILHDLEFSPDGNFAQLIQTSSVGTMWFALSFALMFFIGFTGIRMTSFRLMYVSEYGILEWLKFFIFGCLFGMLYIMLVGAPLWGVAWDELPSIFDLKQTYLDGLKYTFITGMVLWFLIAILGCVAANSQDCRDMMMTCMARI